MTRHSSARRGKVAAAVLACACAVLASPREAAAQRTAFVDALIAFRTALAGNFGDEGRLVTPNLDRMATSLTVWDRVNESTLVDLRARIAGASGEQARRLRTELITLLVDRGRLSEALGEIDAAIAADPTRPVFHQWRGLVNEAAGAAGPALDDFRQSWTLDPSDPVNAYLVADRTSGEGADRTPQIETLLAAQRVKAASPSFQAPVFTPTSLVQDRAADWIVFAPAAYAEGFSLVARGRYVDAVAAFRSVAARDPLIVDPVSRNQRMAPGIAALRQKRFDEAIQQLQPVAASAAASSEAHRILGAAYLAAGRAGEAIDQLKTAVMLAPRDERSRMALGRALMRDGQLDEAERQLRETADLLPESADAHLALADLDEQRNRGPDALAELEAVERLPILAGRGQLYWRLADLHHRHQDFEAVTRLLSRRARLDPGNAAVHKDLGLAHMRRGAREDALIELVMATLLGPDDAETLATIGQIHLDSGRYEQAEPVLRRATVLDPALAQARFALGTTLVRLGRVEEGRGELAEFQRLRTAALDEQRRAFAFEKLIREAELRTSEGRHDQAAEMWKQVVELEPGVAAHRIALAGALTRAGQLQAAAAELEEAARLNGGSSVYRQLASIYEKLGRTDDSARAQSTYERLLREQQAEAPR